MRGASGTKPGRNKRRFTEVAQGKQAEKFLRPSRGRGFKLWYGFSAQHADTRVCGEKIEHTGKIVWVQHVVVVHQHGAFAAGFGETAAACVGETGNRLTDHPKCGGRCVGEVIRIYRRR